MAQVSEDVETLKALNASLKKQLKEIEEEKNIMSIQILDQRFLEEKMEHQQKETQWKKQENDTLLNAVKMLQNALLTKEKQSKQHSNTNLSIGQQNFMTLTTQLQAIQLENSTLTKDLCLKESFLQLKEQQFRVMQSRMEELEKNISLWKEKYIQQLALTSSSSSFDSMTISSTSTEWIQCSEYEIKTTNGENLSITSLIERLSSVNREKLKKLVDLKPDDTTSINENFEDVPEEFKRVLFSYLLPSLQEQTNQKVQCFVRQSQRVVMDIKISSTNPTISSASTSASAGPTTTTTLERLKSGSSSITTTTTTTTTTSGSTTPIGSTNPYEFHYFDLVDGNKVQQHCTRELHPTKALYVSRSMASIAKRASNTAAGGSGGGSLTSAPSPASSSTSGTSGTSGTSSGGRMSLSAALASGAMTNGFLSHATPPSAFGTITEEAGAAGHKMKKIVGGFMGGVKDRIHARTGGTSNASNTKTNNTSNTIVATCEGCGKSPLVGIHWRCRTCLEDDSCMYELCEKCYGQGMHGKDNEEELYERIMQIVITKCPRLFNEQELIKLLRFGICKTNLKKFSFCLNWIADLIACKNTKELRARALEISQITPKVRSDFVRLLTQMLAFRGDIELITEWEPVRSTAIGGSSNNSTASNSSSGSTTGSGATATATGSNSNSSSSGGGGGELDTLRIWVKDKEPFSNSTRCTTSTTSTTRTTSTISIGSSSSSSSSTHTNL